MRQDRVIYLIGMTIVPDAIRNQVEIPTERKVYAEELTVYLNEFYSAAVTGLRPEKVFEIYTREFHQETKLKYNNIIYRIIRTSPGKTSEKTRLTCEKVVADG